MSRTDHIEQQKELGRKAIAVLPIHYPKELLTAMGILAVEMWGPPGPPRGPDAGRIQAYVCAVVRNALGFIAGGGADSVDAILFPHTCDSIQGLATLAPDLGGWSRPAFRFMHPKGDDRPSARRFVAAELEALATELESLTGTAINEEALREAIRLHRRIDGLRARLLDRRAHLEMDDTELYALLRRGEYLWPEDHLKQLQQAERRLAAEPVQQEVPVMVTGYVPEPAALLATINEAGAWIAADDYAGIGRRLVRAELPDLDNPLAALVELYFSAPPCPTRQPGQLARLAHLEGELERSAAAGLIIHTVAFCEPELFDVPAIRSRFEARGVPVLHLEGELESDLSGQAVTRIEAFIEMLHSGGARRAS